MKKFQKMFNGINLNQIVHMKLSTFMGSLEIDIKQVSILEKITMKLYSLVLLLEQSKISQQESKNSSEVLKRKKMLKSIFQDSLIIKMILQQQMLQVVKQEILQLLENAEKCQLFMFGIISLCNLLETFNQELRQKELQLQL